MDKFKHLMVYLVSLLLISCSSNQYYEAESKVDVIIDPLPTKKTGTLMEAVGYGVRPAIKAPTPVWDILLSSQTPKNKYGAYGYLLFTKRANNQEWGRYVSVCEAFKRNLEPVSEYSYLPSNKLMPTYWLLTTTFEIPPNCDDWVTAYDYARAKVLASAISSLSSKGPLLVAWSKSFEEVTVGENALIFDLSTFSDSDLDRALGIWMDRVTRDPELWNNGFNIIKAKEIFRSFLEKYGNEIIMSITTIKETIS